jgi:cAMP-dependent protein kinase regulator
MMGCENSKEAGSSNAAAASAGGGQHQKKAAAAAPGTSGSARPFRDPSVALPRAAPKAATATGAKKKDAGGHVKNVFAKPLDVAEGYRPPVHEKSQDEIDFITSALQKNFVFENMSPRELKPLIMAFEKSQVASGATIISQGDAGDYFYIIQMGACSFSVDGKEVGQAKTGDSFGELALLYTCPRAASVKATVNTTLLRVDQTSFRYILQNQTKEGFKAKQDLLTKLSFLQDLDEENINKLTAVMTPHPFKKGDYLMKKGDVADYFYVVQEGTLLATNIGVADSKFEDVTVSPGEYVGERALVTGEPRAADVIAQTDGMCFCIDEKTFKKVLGNLNELILRSQDQRKLVRLLYSFFCLFVFRVNFLTNTHLCCVVICSCLQSSIKVFRDSHFDTQTLASLCRLFKDKEVKKGDIVFKEGDTVEAALYMVRSTCKVVLKNKAGTLDEQRDGGGYFGDQQLLADAKAGKNKAGDPTTVVSEYTVEVVEGGMLGVLTLAACRTVFDTLFIGQELAGKVCFGSDLVKADIKLENLERHKILGAGTFGQVWLVSDKAAAGDKTPYALKIQSKYELVKDGQAKAVVDEKNIMAQLQHPFLIHLVATFKGRNLGGGAAALHFDMNAGYSVTYLMLLFELLQMSASSICCYLLYKEVSCIASFINQKPMACRKSMQCFMLPVLQKGWPLCIDADSFIGT